jgi:hypothetical protein
MAHLPPAQSGSNFFQGGSHRSAVLLYLIATPADARNLPSQHGKPSQRWERWNAAYLLSAWLRSTCEGFAHFCPPCKAICNCMQRARWVPPLHKLARILQSAVALCHVDGARITRARPSQSIAVHCLNEHRTVHAIVGRVIVDLKIVRVADIPYSRQHSMLHSTEFQLDADEAVAR